MALKYQALNGTVINKTTTIQGMDLTNPGTPHFLQGLTSVEGYIFPFLGFSGRQKSEASFYFNVNSSAQGSNAAPYSSTVAIVEIDGVTYRGVTVSRLVFSCYPINPDITKATITGKITVIKANKNQGLFIEDYNLQQSISFNNSQTAALQLTIPKNTDDVILSVTFEPAE